jgi:hypothetical protein
MVQLALLLLGAYVLGWLTAMMPDLIALIDREDEG